MRARLCGNYSFIKQGMKLMQTLHTILINSFLNKAQTIANVKIVVNHYNNATLTNRTLNTLVDVMDVSQFVANVEQIYDTMIEEYPGANFLIREEERVLYSENVKVFSSDTINILITYQLLN
jgi:hypothetical protein